MIIKVKKIDENAIIPTCGSLNSAGYDLYSVEDAEILPHQNTIIHTGIVIEIPTGFFGGIFARSGLATKMGIRPANCVGVIDADYRGEVLISLHNDFDQVYQVSRNDRIAQLVVMPCEQLDFEEIEDLTMTQRNANGFGSSGK